jgi:TonB family protein
MMFAAVAVSVALALEATPADRIAPLRAGLASDDAQTRAAAARIVAVTESAELIDDVRKALQKETNAEAAREEVRAIGMSGGVKELDALLAQSKRFDSNLDEAAWTAVARGAGPEAISELLSRKSDKAYGILGYALWGHPELALATSARILGRSKPALWREWLATLRESNLTLDPQIAAVALAHPVAEISAAMAWELASRYETKPPPDPKPFLDALDRVAAASPDASLSDSFGRELLARALGRQAHEREEWTKWIALKKRSLVPVSELLTREERKAAEIPAAAPAGKRSYEPPPPPAPFDVMTDLPAGVAEDVLAATGCRPEWVGVAAVGVDRAGRVRALDLSQFGASKSCIRALDVLLRSSLARNVAINSGYSANNIILVHVGSADLCIDEPPVSGAPESAMRPEATTTPPKKISHVNPIYPESSRLARVSGIVILQAVITPTGCIGSLKLLKPLTPELNTSALIAASQWRFSPGLVDGKPVPVIYNLTVNFKLDH